MNAKPSLVSIIIPTYNRAHLIGETLDSVLAQTYENWECIVVDDGSTDATALLLADYCTKDPRFQYRHRPADRPKGANACRNYGFEVSNGEYIMFVDSDDLITNACIENRVNNILKYTTIDFLITDTAILGSDSNHPQKINRDPTYFTNENYLLLFLGYHLPWTIMSGFWKRKVIQEYSFDESLERLQDVDFHISIFLNNKFLFKRIQSIDNFYICGAEDKGIKENYTKAVVSSFFKIIDKYATIINANKEYRSAFKRFCFIISRDFIFFNAITDKENLKILFMKLKAYKLMDFKEQLFFSVFRFYCKFGLINKKGFGVHRFRKYANSYFNHLILNSK